MSSRGRCPAASSTASWTRWATHVGRQARAGGEQRGEVAVAEELAPRGAHLRDAVRVEDHEVARRELDLDVGEHGRDVGAEQRAELPDGLHAPAGAQHERERMAAAGERHPGAVAAAARGRSRRRCRSARRRGRRAAPCAAARAPRSGRDSYAAAARSVWRASAVTDAASGPLPQTSPISAATAAGARREEVVEVAADLDALAGGDEAHGGGRGPGTVGQARRQQRALQHLGDVALARVGLRLGDGHGGELAELGEDRLVARRERALRAGRRTSSIPSGRPALRSMTPSGAPSRRRGARRRAPPRSAARAYGSPAALVIVARRAPSTARAASTVCCSVSSVRRRRVDPHGRVGQRAQLHHVLVLDPRHLLHLVVAAVGDLERRQGLAQEHRRRPPALRPRARRRGSSRSASRDRLVVRLGELHHAELGGDGLAPERVGRAELALVAVRQPFAERPA